MYKQHSYIRLSRHAPWSLPGKQQHHEHIIQSSMSTPRATISCTIKYRALALLATLSATLLKTSKVARTNSAGSYFFFILTFRLFFTSKYICPNIFFVSLSFICSNSTNQGATLSIIFVVDDELLVKIIPYIEIYLCLH